MNIDWTKQPEGFPLWLEGTNEEHRKHSGWYRRAGEVFEGAFGGQWRSVREGQFFNVHRKPESTAWFGEGLPPAGTVCAVLNSDLGNPQWERCTILYSGKHRVIYDSESCEERVAFIEDLKFRQAQPIRTTEQIAAEDRQKELDSLTHELYRDIGMEPRDAERLFNKGYRKQVQP